MAEHLTPRLRDITRRRRELRLSVAQLEAAARQPLTHYYSSQYDDLQDWLMSLRGVPTTFPTDTPAG